MNTKGKKRPKRLPIKNLIAHIKILQWKHKLKIKWNADKFYYNGVDDVVFLGPIKTQVDYLSALHEIGHALTPELERVRIISEKEETERNYLLKIDILKAEKKDRISLLTQLKNLVDRLTKLTKLVESAKWRWNNEMMAWQYVINTTLVWDRKFEGHIRECMMTYWIGLREKKIMSFLEIEKSYSKFKKTFVDPIFHRINNNI